jgi:hypothetical protein
LRLLTLSHDEKPEYGPRTGHHFHEAVVVDLDEEHTMDMEHSLGVVVDSTVGDPED